MGTVRFIMEVKNVDVAILLGAPSPTLVWTQIELYILQWQY